MPETHPQEPSVTEHARFASAFRASAKRSVEQDRARRAERLRARRRPPMLLLLSTMFLAACASPELQPSPAFPLIFSANPPRFQVLANDGITLQEVTDFVPVNPADPSATVHQRVSCMLAIPRDNPQIGLGETIPEQLSNARLKKDAVVKLPPECGDPTLMDRTMQASVAPGAAGTPETPPPILPPPSTPSSPPEQTEQPSPEQDPRQELARVSVMIEGVDASGVMLVRCAGGAIDIRRVADRAIVIFQTARHCIEATDSDVSRRIDWSALTGFRITSPYGPLDSRVNFDSSGSTPPPFHIASLPGKDVAAIGFSIPLELESKIGIAPIQIGSWEPNATDGVFVIIDGVARGPFHLSTDLFGLRRAPIETTGFEDGYVILRQDDGVIAGPNDSGGLVAIVQDGHPVGVGVLSAADLEDVPLPRQWVVTRVTPQEYEVLANQIVSALAP